MTRHTFFATCAPGVESLLYAEVRALGLNRPEQQVGGVRFEGTLEDCWKANLWLRTAVRVLLRLERFHAPDEDALYQAVLAVDWSQHLSPGGTLWVDAQCKDSNLDHSRYVAQRVKDGVVDRLRTEDGTRPDVQREDPDLRLHLHLYRDRATLSLDSSGDSLHKRGWRRAQGIAPLAETLAAAVVLASGWDRRSPLIDPFCGSGTLLVEAALIAGDMAPGVFRKRFGFEGWPGHDAEAYAEVHAAATSAGALPRKLRLLGFDADRARVAEAQANLESAGLAQTCEIEVAQALEFAPRPGWNAWIVCNPPYGERLGDDKKLIPLYRDFGRLLRERCEGFSLALLSGNPDLAGRLALPDFERRTLQNGSIPCELILGRI
ncbi:MAG: hypothetical protein CMJ98_09090 [Planctomycetes bacterium]|jgi:23S rRNA (guanine2445-N2)-methyltransferase / 23S rRNA (guanine2069-N7)-methyltransferase|nr:hypothetical protein [Planctomycetota bacterium]HJM58180.1 THUMP domain-containing protein [Planctomycetota bacterium]